MCCCTLWSPSEVSCKPKGVCIPLDVTIGESRRPQKARLVVMVTGEQLEYTVLALFQAADTTTGNSGEM